MKYFINITFQVNLHYTDCHEITILDTFNWSKRNNDGTKKRLSSLQFRNDKWKVLIKESSVAIVELKRRFQWSIY